MAASHVPKFGNWDGDNVPYTAYFENARKGKYAGAGAGTKMINPNDPEENPEAFALMSAEMQAHNNSDHHRNSQKNIIRSSSSERNSLTNSKSSFSHSAADDRHQRRQTSDLKRNSNQNSNRFIPTASPITPRNGRNPTDDISYRSTASVPKFGAWDEKDPRSGEGFTVIFNKVKEEKQIAASKLQVNQQPSYSTAYADKPAKSKMFCCLF